MEEKIIEFVRENPFLYNKKHNLYKNVYLRDNKFEELATALIVPANQLKGRWRTLRDKFNKEKRNKPASGSAAEVKKPWKWMEQMAFLNEVESSNFNTSGNFDMFESDTDEQLDVVEESTNQSSSLDAPELFMPVNKRRKPNFDATIDSARNELAELANIAKDAFKTPTQPTSSSHKFFDAMAQQVDEYNLTAMQRTRLHLHMQSALVTFLEINDIEP